MINKEYLDHLKKTDPIPIHWHIPLVVGSNGRTGKKMID